MKLDLTPTPEDLQKRAPGEHQRLVVALDERGILTLTLNHPPSLNGMTTAVADQLRDELERANLDDTVRCVVLTGSGRAFCAGQDLRSDDRELGAEVVLGDHYAPLVLALTECSKPTIAALNGVAAGLGASLALACDLRVASEEASLAFLFSRIGLAADGGASWFLPRLTSPAVATELLLLGRRLTAAESRDLGLVSAVVATDEFATHVTGLARQLADGPTAALGLVKQQLRGSASNSLEQQLTLELATQTKALGAPENNEGRAAFLEKRTADFRSIPGGQLDT